MSFQQGLSGLNGASKQLETIGNNIANANTVGFKSAVTQFADVYANSLSGTSGLGTAGIGTRVSQIAQQFSQGNITASNSSLDMAINGGGFFRLNKNGAISYARNGQFQIDKDGYLVSADAGRLTGFVASNTGVLQTGSPTDLRISTADLAPKETVEVEALLNLDSRATVPGAFNATDPTTFNNSTSVTVFDSLGNSHVVQLYFRKTAANAWDVHATSATGTIAAGPVASITFDSAGNLVGGSPGNISIALTNGAGTPINGATGISLDFSSTTQFGSAFGVNSLTQDGFASGRLSGFNVGSDGTITGRYTNGKTSTLGQVVLANFSNPNGLQPLGNNQWAESNASGVALVGAPNSGRLGLIQSSATEDSNVDLTAELVNMITAQRVFQANAQTIKTQDQVLQTLVNLR
ncbi:flagellar hook protein FlgE [Noviherbaspirillum denitrificans]|uniref:Flagellar hook protein FlgE n=1 Tax=Noviherbaspirillum denitrificans TaxID=1968433 RepID=A0A254TCT9_9BURK|nr:flagellar hook protein FlgE [Noviherbaspirillum denitrificans]OWW19987.1 flagellar biosynthesis protein FlgE [Noviherbaspirillum denitrificans]